MNIFKLVRNFSAAATPKNPKVYFDVSINNVASGRLVFEVNIFKAKINHTYMMLFQMKKRYIFNK